MTGDKLPDEAPASEPGVSRLELPDHVRAHADSPSAWAELAEVAVSEDRELEAYAYATVAHRLGLDALAASGWSEGQPLPWSDASNRGILRATHVLAHAASLLGRTSEAAQLADFLDAADPDAGARIVSEHTPTQLITIIPQTESAPDAQPATEAFVVRGED